MLKKYQPVGTGMLPSTTELGKFIRKCRLEIDASQKTVANRVKIGGQTHWSQIERGQCQYIKKRALPRIAKVLGCEEEELSRRVPVKHAKQPQTELGKFIRGRREELGLKLPKFARRMNWEINYARQMEAGKASPVFNIPQQGP